MLLMIRVVALLLASMVLAADEPTIPEPPKPDIPYILLVDHLVPTDAIEAQEEPRNKGKKSEETTYWVNGEHATARTPLASPVFAIKQDSLALERLQVFSFEIRNGRREVTFSRKSKIRQYSLTTTKVKDALFRLEVDQ